MSVWKTVGTGLWVRPYLFGGNPINTSVVDIGDGDLLVLSPGTKMPEADFAELDKIGTVKALGSPGAYHNMGLPQWSERYPDAGLYGPDSAIGHIAKAHKKLRPLQDFGALSKLLPEDVRIEEMAGCKHPDALLVVKRDDATTWFTNEVLTNAAALPGNPLFKLAFAVTGSGPGLNVNKVACMLIRAKKPAVRDYFKAKLQSDPPTRLVPCHGEVLEAADLAAQIDATVDRRLG